MSKFWDEEESEEEEVRARSADEGSEEDESGAGSDDDGDNKPRRDRGAARKFAEMDDWESSSDEKRTILTAGEKLQRQLQDVVVRLNSVLEEHHDLKDVGATEDERKDWPIVPNFSEAKVEVDAGVQLLDKFKKVVQDEGVPGFFVRAVARFCDAVSAVADKSKKDKKFRDAVPKDLARYATDASRLTTKLEKEGRLASDLAEFRKDPTNEKWKDKQAEDKADVSSDDDDDKGGKGTGPKRGTREFWVKQPGDSSSEEEAEGNASWLDESDSGELGGDRDGGDDGGDDEGEKKQKKPSKKPGAKTKKHKGKVVKTTSAKGKESGDEEEPSEDEEEDLKVSSTRVANQALEEEKDLKSEDVDRLTEEMSQLRGRKGTDYSRLMRRLELILPKSKSDAQRLRLLILFINTRFDSVKTTKARLSAKDWRASVENIKQILQILRTNPQFRMVELDAGVNMDEDFDDEEQVQLTEQQIRKKQEKRERNRGLAQNSAAAGKTVVNGSLFALLERLDAAFMKTLQQIDPHTQEYVTRLSDDPDFVTLAKDMLTYQQSIGDDSSAAKTAHLIISHMYFKYYESVAKGEVVTTKRVDYTKELQKYAAIIYQSGGARRKAQAMLMCIYHYALQDNFFEARDRMLMSHLQEKASMMDIDTQILFNRTNVQIGLCAFRNGLLKEAHSILSEIYAGGRVKELLGQGTSSQRYQDKDKEQEKVEKSRMIPFHMHINLELLETCHLISAMMLEVPAMASERYSRGAPNSSSERVTSKYLRKLVDYHERQVFAGPPETTRDFVVSGARALSRGNWKKTSDLLLTMPAWDLIDNKEKVKSVIQKQVQEVGLKTYLFTYCSCFETVSTDMLAKLFELSNARVHAIVSGMMLNDELKASWNQPTGTIKMHNIEPSSLQNAAVRFTQRISSFIESNEALLDSKHGPFHGRDKRDDGSAPQKGDKEKGEKGDRETQRYRERGDRGDRGDRGERGDRERERDDYRDGARDRRRAFSRRSGGENDRNADSETEEISATRRKGRK